MVAGAPGLDTARDGWLSLVGLLGLPALSGGCTKKSAEDVPVLGQLPEFSLVDQDEQAFVRESMEGNLWVSAFVFTHCRSTCPRLTAHMKGLQTRLSDVPSANFVSRTSASIMSSVQEISVGSVFRLQG